jgi:hypothetical protein
MFSCSTACCGGDGAQREEITAEDSMAVKRGQLEAAEAAVASSADTAPFAGYAGQLETEKTQDLEFGEVAPVEEATPQPDDLALAAEPIVVQVQCSPDCKLGITIDMCDDELCFVKMLRSTGVVPDWNANCPKGQDVQLFYRLTGVNSKKDKTKEMVKVILSCITNSERLRMDFNRPIMFIAAINKKNGHNSLGLEASKAKQEYLAPQTMASEGALEDYNRTVDEHRKISASSRIIAVDGQSMPGEEILERMTSLQSFNLTVLNWLD